MSLKFLEQQRRKAVVGVAACIGCLITVISSAVEEGVIGEIMAEGDSSHEESDDEVQSTSVHQSLNIQGSPPSAASRGIKRKRRSTTDPFCEALNNISKSMKSIADALSEANNVVRETKYSVPSWKDVFAELEKLELGDDLMSAYVLLVEDKRSTAAFFGLPVEWRKRIVLHLLSKRQKTPTKKD